MKNLNMINKIITVILLSIGLYFNSSILLLYFVYGVVIVCFFNLKSLKLAILYLVILIFRITNVNIWFDRDKIYYLIMIIGIVILMIKSFSIIEKRYIFDNTLYKTKDKKTLKKHLYNFYYNSTFDKNIKNIEKQMNSTNHKYLINQTSLNTKRDLEDMYVLNRIRFYGLYDRKRTFFPDKWKKSDTLYLCVITIIFLIIVYFR